ncbi:MAG: nuclear transport factor 2 family protein [Thermoleophilaceae bacterium]|jgi:ketosteroid isomerase-like protein
MSNFLHLLDRGYTLMWREGRPEDALRNLPEEFEWVVPNHPEGAVHRGPDGVIEFFREWTEPWEDFEIDWELELGAPDRVLATITMRGRGRGSGVLTDMTFFQIWTYREGRFVRMEMYRDGDEARAAAGGA